jgi:hypothetical protein
MSRKIELTRNKSNSRLLNKGRAEPAKKETSILKKDGNSGAYKIRLV